MNQRLRAWGWASNASRVEFVAADFPGSVGGEQSAAGIAEAARLLLAQSGSPEGTLSYMSDLFLGKKA